MERKYAVTSGLNKIETLLAYCDKSQEGNCIIILFFFKVRMESLS